jgi:hypothetical protein
MNCNVFPIPIPNQIKMNCNILQCNLPATYFRYMSWEAYNVLCVVVLPIRELLIDGGLVFGVETKRPHQEILFS